MAYAAGGDPGEHGAFSLFEVGDAIALKYVTSFSGVSADEWVGHVGDLLLTYRPEMIRLENVHYISGQGGVSAFTFGFNAGTLNGVTTFCGLPFERTDPQVWQRKLNLPRNHHITDERQRRRARTRDQKRIAIATWPELKRFEKTQHDPYAGVLIGFYAAVLLLEQITGVKQYVILQQDKLQVTSDLAAFTGNRAAVDGFGSNSGAYPGVNIVPPPQRFIRG